MNVLIVTTRYGEGLGGKENYLVALAAELARAGHAVRVVTRADDAFPEFSGPARFTAGRAALTHRHAADVRVLPAPGAWAWPCWRLHFHDAAFGLAAACFANALSPALDPHVAWADVVHYDGTGRELLGHVALRLCEKHRRAFVVCPHLHVGSWGDSAPDLALYARAHGLIAKTQVEAAVLGPRATVIPNGPYLPVAGDARALEARLGGPAPTVLFVGRRTESKGWPLILDAFRRVRAAHPDARLLALSPSDDAGAGAPVDGVHQLAGAGEETKDAAYRLATVLAVPSAAEAFGMAMVEAWSHGVPVVASDIPTLREIVTAARGGQVVPRTAAAFAEALTHALAHPARVALDARFGWDAIAAATVQVYDAARTRV